MCRHSQLSLYVLWAFSFILLFSTNSVFAATVTVEPQVTRSIDGVSDLNRLKYFNLASTGSWYESKISKCNLPNRYDYYTYDLEMTFGRSLGGVYSETHWGSSIHELGTTGTVDIPRMISELNPDNNGASPTFISDYGPNLNIAQHDRGGDQYPTFMDQYQPYTDVGADRWWPSNTVAAADLAVNLLIHGYTDLTRPAFYEIRNEPHWRFWSDPVFIDLHTDIYDKAKLEGLSTEIGGPCYSVGYFYKDSYDALSQITGFIDNTNAGLDFYSFHTYDYMSWSGTVGAGGDFVGRITSGLPLDGVIDAVVNDAINVHGKEISLVFSEQGGYVSNGNGDTNATDIANYYFPLSSFPGTAWEWEMQKRSIINFIMVNSALGNTMAYMNHPHIVKKGVPFILDESAGWDPAYYSSLLVSENFASSVTTYWESKLIHFFEYFKDVRGRRIKSYCDDPDLQHHAFVDQNKLILLFNNTSMAATPLNFLITDPDTVNNIMIRRLGRNTDFTPYLTESPISDLTGIQIQPLEAIVVFVEYNSTITEVTSVDEVPYYGDKTEVVMPGSTVETFTVNIPEYALADYGILRIATGRPSGTDHDITVVLNGQPLSIPVEDSASRTDNGNEYGTLKSIKVDGSLLQAVNTVQVSFSSDGLGGGVGSVVIRAGLAAGEQDPPTPNPATWASPPAADSGTAISMTATTGTDASGPVEYYFAETSGNPGGSDSGWQTSPSYTDTGLYGSTQYTYTVQMRDALQNTGTASISASTTTDTVPDIFPPVPNPATFASPPAADSDTAISMTATVGTDTTGPVEYYFAETSGNPGGTDSGWQTSPSYTDTGLNPATQYTYTVQMRDALLNTGTASGPANATTDDTIPPTPNPATFSAAPAAISDTAISMTATIGTDISGPVEYYFAETSGNPGGSDSGWQESYSYTDTGLSPLTEYTYTVQMRDAELNTGTASTPLPATTQAPGQDVEITGFWISGTSHIAESGSDRCLVFTVHAEDSGVDLNASVTYGGQAMTKVVERNESTGYRAYVAAFVLDEAGISDASGSTFNVSWAQTPSASPAYSSVFLKNVDQSAMIGATAANGGTSGTITTTALSTGNGDMVIVAGTCGDSTGTYTVNNGFSEALELSPSSAVGVAGYKSATGASEIPSLMCSSVNRQAIIGFVIQGAAASSSPYSGTPISLPGKLQTEEYDLGGESIAYHDTTAGNTGGDFRSDDVDITAQYGGYVLAWTTEEEWLKYTVDAAVGTYDITVQASTDILNRSLTLTLDGNTLGTINIPSMGWSTFNAVTLKDVVIPATNSGILQLTFNGSVNVDWIDFTLLKGDADFSGAVDSDDLYLLASQWLSDCLVEAACSDMDYSGKVDYSDFMILSGGWMMP